MCQNNDTIIGKTIQVKNCLDCPLRTDYFCKRYYHSLHIQTVDKYSKPGFCTVIRLDVIEKKN